jgi:hypothetical protein
MAFSRIFFNPNSSLNLTTMLIQPKQPYFLAIHYGNGANRTKANHNYMLAEKTGIFIV